MEIAWLTPRVQAALLMFVIATGVAARLYRVNGPPRDAHWYRQYETAAISRNFYDGSMNLFYPQVDWRGESPGYVECEFPIYQYLVALLYQGLGPDECWARILNIAIYAISALILFKLTQRVYDGVTGLIAVLLYSFLPLSYFFTRTIQPDAVAALGSLAGLYFFWIWTETGRWRAFAAAVLGIAVSVLIKPPNLYLGLPLTYLLFARHGWGFLRRPSVWLFAALALSPSYFWYRHAYSLWHEYGNTLIRAYVEAPLLRVLTEPVVVGQQSGLAAWCKFGDAMLDRFIFQIATPAGVVLCLYGVFSRPLKANWIFHFWAFGFVVSMLLAPDNHFGHNYYQLPIMFFASAFLAHGTLQLWRGKNDYSALGAVVLGIAVLAASLVAQRVAWRYGSSRNPDYLAVTFVLLSAGICAVLGMMLRFRIKRFAIRGALVSLLVLTVAMSAREVSRYYFRSQHYLDRIAFGKRVEELTKAGTKLIFVSDPPHRPGWYQHVSRDGVVFYHDPIDFYNSHREGWSIGIDQLTPELVEKVFALGADHLCYFVSTKYGLVLRQHPDIEKLFGERVLAVAVEVTPAWGIYRLRERHLPGNQKNSG